MTITGIPILLKLKTTLSNYWTTARNEANAIGGYLVVINDDAENTLVWQAVRAYSTSITTG